MTWAGRIFGLALLAIFCWVGFLYCGWGVTPTIADRIVLSKRLNEAATEASLRVTFVGTSLTASYDWPDYVSERVQACSDRTILVSRVALAGATSDWGKKQAQAVAALQPDLVFIEFSVNDADLRNRLSRRQSSENHQILINDLQERMPQTQIVLMTMSPAHGLRRLLRPFLSAYYQQYQDLSATLNIGLLDLYPRWLALAKSTRSQADGLHPSQAAATAVILPAMTEYLAAYLGAPC